MSVDMSTMNGRDAREIRLEPWTLDSGFGPITGLRVYPSVADYYDGKVHERPAVFAHGWGESIRTTVEFGSFLAHSGIDVTLYTHPRMNRRIMPVADVQMFRSAMLGTVLNSIEGEKDLIAHSEGAYAALRAAAERDDIVAAQFAAPAGLSGTFTPGELVQCAYKEGRDAFHGTRTNALGALALGKAFYGLARNVIGSPQLSGAEVLSIAMTDAKPDLEAAIENGVRLGILACSADRLFPAERILSHLDGLENKIERFSVLDMNHFNFLMNRVAAQAVLEETKALYGLAS